MKYQKLSAALAVLVFEYENFTGDDFLAVQPSRPQAVSISGNGLTQATVFIYCDAAASFENLEGIRVVSGNGNIRTAQVELKKIDELSEMPSVVHLSVSMRLRPLYDFAAVNSALNDFKVNHPELTAKDVIIGIVDSGINSAQPIFADRIHSIWDQELSKSDEETVKYGRELPDGHYSESFDSDGHGTQIAGILSDCFKPESKFVIVKTDFQNACIADGIRYIFETAEKLGKPAIVSVNLDGFCRPQNVTDDLSAFIKQETNENKFVIMSESLNKFSKNCSTATVEPNIYLPKRLKFSVSANNQPGSPLQITLRGWFEAEGDCEIMIMSPNGMATKTSKPGVNENPTRTGNYLTSQVFLTVPAESTLKNGVKEFFMDLRPIAPKQFVAGGSWQLTVKNLGKTAVNLSFYSMVPDKPKEIKFI